jgi:hypothetical protein
MAPTGITTAALCGRVGGEVRLLLQFRESLGGMLSVLCFNHSAVRFLSCVSFLHHKVLLAFESTKRL